MEARTPTAMQPLGQSTLLLKNDEQTDIRTGTYVGILGGRFGSGGGGDGNKTVWVVTQSSQPARLIISIIFSKYKYTSSRRRGRVIAKSGSAA